QGTNQSTGIPLPYIPALHSQHELKWTFKTGKNSMLNHPYATIQLEVHFAQKRVDEFETPTPGVVLLNSTVGTQLKVGKQNWTLFIGGKNLTNRSYFDHLNRLKPMGIHNMGLNATVGVLIPIGLYEK
ncbi:MAG: hypothetical protein WCL00_12005, partial [Bacteroidota bacterium]